MKFKLFGLVAAALVFSGSLARAEHNFLHDVPKENPVIDEVDPVEAILGQASKEELGLSALLSLTVDKGVPSPTFKPGAGGTFSFAASGKAASSLGHRELQALWNECAGTVTAYYNDPKSKCTTRFLSAALARKLDKHLLACVQSAASSVLGLPEGVPSKMSIGHQGVSPDPRHSERSLHAVGRALDLMEVGFTHDDKAHLYRYLDASAAYRLSKQGKVPDAKLVTSYRFFKVVENCWGALSPDGTAVNASDPDHQDHVHLSIPFVPNPDGFFIK